MERFFENIKKLQGIEYLSENVQDILNDQEIYERFIAKYLIDARRLDLLLIGTAHDHPNKTNNQYNKLISVSQNRLLKLLEVFEPDVVGVEGGFGENWSTANQFGIISSAGYMDPGISEKEFTDDLESMVCMQNLSTYKSVNPKTILVGMEDIQIYNLAQLVFTIEPYIARNQLSIPMSYRELKRSIHQMRSFIMLCKATEAAIKKGRNKVAIPFGKFHLYDILEFSENKRLSNWHFCNNTRWLWYTSSILSLKYFS